MDILFFISYNYFPRFLPFSGIYVPVSTKNNQNTHLVSFFPTSSLFAVCAVLSCLLSNLGHITVYQIFCHCLTRMTIFLASYISFFASCYVTTKPVTYFRDFFYGNTPLLSWILYSLDRLDCAVLIKLLWSISGLTQHGLFFAHTRCPTKQKDLNSRVTHRPRLTKAPSSYVALST